MRDVWREGMWCLSLKLNTIREADESARVSDHAPRQTCFQATCRTVHLKGKIRKAPIFHPLTLPLTFTHKRRCQGHKLCLHHYLLHAMFVQARSVGGNRWCVWQVCWTQAGSAFLRADRADMCPDHRVSTCTSDKRLSGSLGSWLWERPQNHPAIEITTLNECTFALGNIHQSSEYSIWFCLK